MRSAPFERPGRKENFFPGSLELFRQWGILEKNQPAKGFIMIEHNTPFLAPGETLVCFGDSLTSAGNGYVSILQERLTENTVINAGRGGDKTPSALTRFNTDVLIHNPDAISLFFGANDAAIGRGRWVDEPMVSPETYKHNLMWMVHLARLKGVKKFSITVPFDSFEGNALLEQGDIMTPYCLAAREAANMMQVRMVPLDIVYRKARLAAPDPTALFLTCDGTHPTASTYKLIAESFLTAWKMA